MKSRFLMCTIPIALLLALAIPVSLAAQDNHNHHHKHHHYKLMDLGTFGGPTNWYCSITQPSPDGTGPCPVLNKRGTIVGGADTSLSNPNQDNPNPFVPPETGLGDPYIQHAYQWKGGALQDLGTLPGGYNSDAFAVSPNGLIAGLSENGAFDPLTGWPEVHAVLWENSGQSIIDLGTLEGGYESVPNGVNSRGLVVGFSLNTISDSFFYFPQQMRAFVWDQNDGMKDLGTLGTGTDAFATFLNESGQVAGASFTNTTVNPVMTFCTAFQLETPTMDPFLWDGGKLKDLGSLGGTCGIPSALSNKGQVVGVSDTAGDAAFHAFLWPGHDGKMQDLGTLGGCCAQATSINDQDTVVGASYPSGGGQDSFIWKHGVMTDLPPHNGCSIANDVNSRDQAVGLFSTTCGGPGGAALWEDVQLIDLNMFNHPGSGFQQLFQAFNINDRGEISGLGLPPNCTDPFVCGHAFVLIPCDEHHPGVEGCDYSLVDATPAAQVGLVSRDAFSGTQRPSPPSRSNRLHFPGRATDQRN
jgi:probable HAF family extracellular repeat protein